MSKQYLHLSAFPCDLCAGPVVAGWVAVRENAISRETGVRHVGSICLTCGHRQDMTTGPVRVRHFPPAEWEPVPAVDLGNLNTAVVEAASSTERH